MSARRTVPAFLFLLAFGAARAQAPAPPPENPSAPATQPAEPPQAQPAKPAAPPPSAAPETPVASPAVAPQPGPERIQGTLVNQGGPLSKYFMAGLFTVDIKRYSSDDEVMACMQALRGGGGENALLEKLWKMKEIGYLKVSGSMGYPLYIARSRPMPDGRLIRCLTNRPMVPSEFGGRSGDYPFGYIEIFLPHNGKGTGTIIPMAEVGFTDRGTLAVESYGTMPFRLLDVAIEVPKDKKLKAVKEK